MATCWECERMTSRPIAVTLAAATLRLCPRCYRTRYLPLIAELAVEVAREAPRSPAGAAPRAPRTPR